MKMMNILNESMDFTNMVNSMSDLAYNITRELRLKENRLNEENLLKEYFRFECENFLYDIKEYPTIKIESAILNHSEILEKYFIEKTKIDSENSIIVKYFEFKEDSNIILCNFEEATNLLYCNNFAKEKSNLNIDKTNNRNAKITNRLMKENKFGEIKNFDNLSEEIKLDIKPINDPMLFENVLTYLNNNFEELNDDNYYLTYNEITYKEDTYPMITYIDKFTEDVKSIYIVECEELFKDNYRYYLNKIFED